MCVSVRDDFNSIARDGVQQIQGIVNHEPIIITLVFVFPFQKKREKKKKKGFSNTNEMRPDVAGKTGIKAGVRKGARWLETWLPLLSMRFEDPSFHLLWRACVELFGKNCRIERTHDSVDIRRNFFILSGCSTRWWCWLCALGAISYHQ